MEFSAKQIAEYLSGTVVGDDTVSVTSLSKIEEGTPGSLSFLANEKYTPFIYETKASIVIVNKTFVPEGDISATMIQVDDAYQSFAAVLNMYDQYKNQKSGIEQPSFIADSADVADDVYVGAFTHIGENVVIGKGSKIYPHCQIGDNVEIGENCLIFSSVNIYADCKLGSDVTLHSGVVVGSDGFGFAPNAGNSFVKVAQIGNVIIEDQVEVGSNTTIDRATMGSTVIRKGVKIDNLIQIAHNVEIGENTVIAAQTGIAGSTRIGKNCMIGGQVGIIGHLNIGDNVKIAAQSGIGKNIPDNTTVQGSPAFEIGDYTKSYVYFRRLPNLANQIHQIEKKLKENE